jgi:hypothetical protein
MATSSMGRKIKPLSIFEQLNIIQEVAGVVNVLQNKTANELGIPVSTFSDKILGLSGTCKNMLRLLQITQIQHTCTKSSQNLKKRNKFNNKATTCEHKAAKYNSKTTNSGQIKAILLILMTFHCKSLSRLQLF